jgi:2-keto-4-pentenoate hydratase
VSDDRNTNDPQARVSLALRAQLSARRAELDSGAVRIGWKVGLHIAEVEEVMGSEPVLGYLTSATRLESGGTFHARGVRALRAESEVAVELGRDVRPSNHPEAVRAAVAGSPWRSNSWMSIPRQKASRGSSRTTPTIGRSS